MKNKKLAVAVMLLSILVASIAAYAAIKYTATIPNTATIKGYKLALWNTLIDAPVPSIAWGSLDIGTTKDTEIIFTSVRNIRIKDTGDYPVFVAWKLNDTLPSGVTLTCDYWQGDSDGVWRPIPQNEFSLLPQISAGYCTEPLRWTLTISADASPGSLAFDILLLAANTMSG